MGGGRTVQTTSSIDPSLQPLFSGSAKRMMEFQRQNPLTGFGGSYPKATANLSDYQKYGGGLITTLKETPATDNIALRDIMRLPELAGRTPTTGFSNAGASPSLYGAAAGAQQSYGPQWMPNTPSAQGRQFGPVPGPDPNDTTPGYVDPGGNGGGAGGDGEVRPPVSQGGGGDVGPGVVGPRGNATVGTQDAKTSGVVAPASVQANAQPNSGDLRGKTIQNPDGSYTKYDALGRSTIINANGQSNTGEGTTGFAGSNHTYSVFRNGQWQTISDPISYIPGGGQSQPSPDLASLFGQPSTDAGRVSTSGVRTTDGTPGRMPITTVGQRGSGTTVVPPREPLGPPIDFPPAGGGPVDGGPLTPRPPITPPDNGRGGTIVVPPRPPLGPPIVPPPNPSPSAGAPNGGPNLGAIGGLLDAQDAPRTGGYTIEGSPGVTAAYKQATGEGIMDNPAVKAQVDAFRRLTQPVLQNQLALSGIKGSGLANATGLSLTSQLAPLFENQLQREQAVNDRGSQATEAELQRRERGMVREADAVSQQIPNLMGLGDRYTQRQMDAINAALGFGQTQQQTEQASNDAEYQDMLRRQALSEQALLLPFGQTMPAAFGSTVNSSGGGLFK